MKSIIFAMIATVFFAAACAKGQSPITAKEYKTLFQDVEAMKSQIKRKDMKISALEKQSQDQKRELNKAKDIESQNKALLAELEAGELPELDEEDINQKIDKILGRVTNPVQPVPAPQPAHKPALPPLPPPSVDMPKYMLGYLYSKPAGTDLLITFTPYDGKYQYYVAVWVNGEPVSFGDVKSLKRVRDLDDTEFLASLVPRGAYAYVPVDFPEGWNVEVQYFEKIINYQQGGMLEYVAVGPRQVADDNVHVKHRGINLNNYTP